MTILTPERLAEIKGRLAFDDERGVTHPHAETLRRLLASHAALQAEVDELRAEVANYQKGAQRDANRIASAAREMRERCAAAVKDYTLHGSQMTADQAISALPLTPTKEPADG